MQPAVYETARQRNKWEDLICRGLQDVDFFTIIENHPNRVLGESGHLKINL